MGKSYEMVQYTLLETAAIAGVLIGTIVVREIIVKDICICKTADDAMYIKRLLTERERNKP